MKVGPTVRPRAEPLGVALAVAGKPTKPPRPIAHRNGAPPTTAYHENHPTLASPAQSSGIPVRATGGVNQTALTGYLKALQRGG